MADIPLKFGSKSQMLDMDAITKSIENTVLSQFQKLTSDLQNELKLELQVPSEITLEKKALNKEINRIKKEIDNALKSVSTEVFEKGLEDRWRFNHTGKYGTDKKDRPIKLKDYDKMVDIRDYKNQRLAMIHQLADITDEGIQIKDSKNLHQLIQNIKAYEEALRRLHELSAQKGQKYKPDEGELNFEKLFDGYKLAGDAKTNAEAIAKAFTSTYVSTLQSELEHKSADLTEVMRKIHRQVYRSAGEQEGVGYEYDKEEYSNAVRKRQDAELHRDRNEAEIENRIRDEINAYIELENKLSDLFDQAGLDLSSDELQELEEKADASISKLKQAIKYLDEYKIDLEALHNSYDFIQDGQESLRDYILNGYEQRTEISTKPQEGYLGALIKETDKSIDAVAQAQKKEDNARQYLDYWKNLLLGLKDTEQMQEVVSDLSAEQIQSSLQELTNKNTELQRRIEELEKEVADYKSVDNSNGQYQTLTVSNIGNELESLGNLEEKLEDVTDAISAKTAAFEDEHTKVTSWLSNETEAVRKLNDELAKVPENASGINIKPTPGFTITSPSSVSNNHQSVSHDDVVQQHKELASAKHLVVEATTDEINAQRELNAEREKAVKEDTTQSNANSLSSQQAIADVIKEQAVAKASVIEQEEKLADVGNEVSDQVQSETKALSQQKTASDQLVASSEKRVAISMRDIELQAQAEQSARRQAESQEANYKAAEAAAQQAKLEAAALNKSSAQSAMNRAASFRDIGLQLQAEQSAEHQSAIWKENSRLASDVANQIQIQAAAQQKANKASQEALKIQARLKDDAWAEARAKVLAQEAEEKSAKQKQPKESKPSDPRSALVDSQNDIDKLTKLYDKIAELETKQSLTGLTPKETASLKQARVDAEQLFEVIKGFATDGERGAQWIQTISNQLDASKADSVKKWSDAYRELSKSLGQLIGTDVKSSEEVLDKLQEHVKNLGGGKLADFSWIKKDAKGVDHFAAQFEAADGRAKQLNATLNGVDGSLRVIVQDSKQNASLLDQFMSGLGKRWQSLLQYLGTFASFYKVVDIIKRGVGIVKELDAAFVELKRISNDSASALEDFRRRQFELADTVGSTSATIINAATEWEHLGYSIKEAEELAKTSAVYKNIADGMTSDSEATEDLVSILKAYNKDAKDAMDVTDALIATSNNYAVTAADIGNILKRSSAALAMGGNTFEETVALGTAMNEVLQQAEVAGSSLKVLSLRLRSSKTELADMGEETDNLVESTPKLRAQIKALTKGFDILESDGKTIKSTYDIMKGIASVWEDMSDVNQAALLELIAGKTRAQGVSALLSNWSQVDEVLKTIAQDEGIALRNNEEKLNTINGRIIQLTNASQRLAQDAFNTEFIKDFISAGTDAVNLLDQIVNKIGAIPTAIGAIGAASTFTKSGGQPNPGLTTYKATGIVRGNTKQVHAF